MHNIGNIGRLKLGHVTAEPFRPELHHKATSPLSYHALLKLISALSSFTKQLGLFRTDAYVPPLNKEMQEGIQSVLSSAFPQARSLSAMC